MRLLTITQLLLTLLNICAAKKSAAAVRIALSSRQMMAGKSIASTSGGHQVRCYCYIHCDIIAVVIYIVML
jgi:hypothetical protein